MPSNKMNIELMKQFNKVSLLNLIRTQAPISRVELSKQMMLSRPSVSEIVTDLITAGWITELDSIKGGRGRRPVPLALNPQGRYVCGVALSASKATIILCNLRAEIVQQTSFPISPNDPWRETLDKIITKINQLQTQQAAAGNRILGTGIAMNGIVDPRTGSSIFAPILGWHNVPVGEYIKNGTQLDTFVEDDAITSALAEQHYGAGKNSGSFITVVADYGIGAGIINNGHIFRGAHNIQGQIGHITVDEDGPMCSCGNFGCLEVMASEPAIVRQVHKRLRMGEQSILTGETTDVLQPQIQQIYLAAQHGDNLAKEVIISAARYLGIGLANLVNLFDPQFIVLGGGIVTMADLILAPIKRAIEQRAMGSQAKQTNVVISNLGDNLYPIGGATLVLENVFSSPAKIDERN